MDSEADRFDHLETLITSKFDVINSRFDALQHDLSSTKDTITQQSTKLNDDVAQMRRVVIDNLMKQNTQLQKRARDTESRLIKLERQVNCTEQNNRKNNIEIDGIPANVTDEQLKSVVADLLNRIVDRRIQEDDIEAVHRLYSKHQPRPTIVRMRRNILEEVKSKEARSKLKGIAKLMKFPNGTKIYINDNLSPAMKSLAYNARLLKHYKMIEDTWFSNAAVRIRRCRGDEALRITHEEDLFKAFPEFEYFSFDCEIYQRIRDEDDMEAFDDLEGWFSDEDNDDDDSSEDDEEEEDKSGHSEDKGSPPALATPPISDITTPGREGGDPPTSAVKTTSSDEVDNTNTGATMTSGTANAAPPDCDLNSEVPEMPDLEEIDQTQTTQSTTVETSTEPEKTASPMDNGTPVIEVDETFTPTAKLPSLNWNQSPLLPDIKLKKKNRNSKSIPSLKSDGAPPNVTRSVAKSLLNR